MLLGSAGANALTAAAGADWLGGRDGNDQLNPGPGRDTASGGNGDYNVLTADREVDQITCGAGNDSVAADDVDLVGAD